MIGVPIGVLAIWTSNEEAPPEPTGGTLYLQVHHRIGFKSLPPGTTDTLKRMELG